MGRKVKATKSGARARITDKKSSASPPPVSAVSTESTASSAQSGEKSSALVFTSLPKWSEAAPSVIITEPSGMAAAVVRLSQHSRIAVDCEGVALSRTGRLCLIQLASPDDVFLVDIVTGGAPLFDAGLRELLESPRCIKVLHDCRHDCDALLHQFGVHLAPVLDTQISFSVLRRVRNLPVGLPVSLKTLLRKFCGVSEEDLTTKDSVKTAMRERGDFWLDRPMDLTSLSYARFDVLYLLHVSKIMAIHITSADSKAYDEHGPRKEMKRWALMLTKAKAEQARRERGKVANEVRSTDPMQRFTFVKARVIGLL